MGAISKPGPSSAASRREAPCSVGVLVSLELAEGAGGHVKCWQRIAEAAATIPDSVNLSVYYLGDSERTIDVGENVRYVTLPPRLGTRRFPFLAQGAGHTDIVPYHPRLAQLLARHDVVHATDVFAFGQTGLRFAKQRSVPVISSIHTDLPLFAEIYSSEIIRRVFRNGALARFFLDDLEVNRWVAQKMRRRLAWMIRHSDHVLTSNDKDQIFAERIIGVSRVSRLRRGIDTIRFRPDRRDRERLAARFGIPEDCAVLLFVGRIDDTKQALFAAEMAHSLVNSGHDIRFLAIGTGAQQKAISDLLGRHAVLPGGIPQEELFWIYPSADIFVFPSESETLSNVVLEAKAAGLPVLVSDHPGTSQSVLESGKDGFVLPISDPLAWRQVLDELLSDASYRRAIGMAARGVTMSRWPSWRDVVTDDLLPIWRSQCLQSVSARVMSGNFEAPASIAAGWLPE